VITKSLRRHVIEDWRGLPEAREEDRLTLVGDSIRKLITRLGLGERISESEILGAWRGIVGDFLADHSTPTRLVDGILHVQVLQPSVRYELDRTWKPEILRKLQAQFGKKAVREIRIRV
jgi:predicted nucleic acid-binding Zn ribbon protein